MAIKSGLCGGAVCFLLLEEPKTMPTITQEQIVNGLVAIEPNLAQLAHDLSPADLSLVRPLLTNPDERVRANAYTLISLTSPSLFLTVAPQSAADQSPLVRMQVAASVQNLSDTELEAASALFVGLLQDPDFGVRKFAVRASGRSHAPEVRAQMERVAGSESPAIP